MAPKFYPITFEPILKERIWGGTKLKTLLDKNIKSEISGESWEISTVENEVSIVTNGFFEGQNLNQIIDLFPEAILGKIVYEKFGKQFPLLFKYLDAREDLSIQVHPNDQLAKARHHSFGKTEMWYVMQADHDARIIVGFKQNSSPSEYLSSLKNKNILEILDTKKVQAGDVFFLETGTVHAIGAGIVIAEIQQTSDITYRIYDFERKDKNGNERELHVDLAIDAINYNKIQAEIQYNKLENISNQVIDCKYFTTNFIPLNGNLKLKKQENSFKVFMCVEGAFEIKLRGEIFSYKKGNTILIPAQMDDYELSGKANILEIFIS